jgi:AcrR family transcriptional regulator
VAEEAFARQGFNGVGMREIASLVGIHSATLYYYFAGKEQLFFAVIERIFQDAHEWVQEALTKNLDGKDKLVYFVEKQFDFLLTHQNYLKIVLHERLSQSPRLREIATRFVRPLVDTLTTFLDEMVKEGIIRSVDSRQTLFQIMTLNAAHIIFSPMLSHVLALGDPVDPSLLQSLKRANVELLLNGLTKES